MRLVLPLLVAAALLPGCAFLDRPTPPGAEGDEIVGTKYAKLLVEIDHPPGYAPNDEALNVLRNTLIDVTGRSGANVQITKDASIPAQAGKKYSWAEIQALEDAYRGRRSGGDTAVLYVVYVAGGSEDDDGDARVLGAAYEGTSLVIFKGNIKDSTGGPLTGRPEERFVERAVLVHEFGHAAGLVNLGTPMVTPHEDPQHPGHSNNRESVMWWAVENTGGLLDLAACVVGFECGANIPFQFDANDKADLRALRER